MDSESHSKSNLAIDALLGKDSMIGNFILATIGYAAAKDAPANSARQFIGYGIAAAAITSNLQEVING